MDGLNRYQRSLLFRNLFGSFDGLNFLEKEGTDDSWFNASATKNTSVWSRDGFVLVRQLFVMVRSELSNSVDSLSAVTAVMGSSRSMSSFVDVLNNDFWSWCSNFSDFVGFGVVTESSPVCDSLDHLWWWLINIILNMSIKYVDRQGLNSLRQIIRMYEFIYIHN